MKNSQYLSEYLNQNAKRGVGKGLTVGSFLAYTLRGEAKKWSGRYEEALRNSLSRAGAIAGPSAGKRTAYYPA